MTNFSLVFASINGTATIIVDSGEEHYFREGNNMIRWYLEEFGVEEFVSDIEEAGSRVVFVADRGEDGDAGLFAYYANPKSRWYEVYKWQESRYDEVMVEFKTGNYYFFMLEENVTVAFDVEEAPANSEVFNETNATNSSETVESDEEGDSVENGETFEDATEKSKTIWIVLPFVFFWLLYLSWFILYLSE